MATLLRNAGNLRKSRRLGEIMKISYTNEELVLAFADI